MSQQALKDINYFITSLTTAFTAFTSWQTIKHQVNIYKKRQHIKQLETTEVLEVDEIKGRGNKVNELVLVRGAIDTKDGKQVQVSSGWNKKQNLALHLKYKEAMFSNDSFDLKRHNYNLNLTQILKNCTIQGSTRISLSSYNKNKVKTATISIKNFDQKDYSKAVQVLKWEENKRDLSLAEHINVILLGLLRALAMLGSEGKDGNYIRGIQIGQRTVQAGIKIGASISVLGKIGFTTEGEVFVEALSIFKDKLPQLNSLRQQLDLQIQKRNFWLTCSLLGVIYLGRRVFKYCKQKNIKIPYLNP